MDVAPDDAVTDATDDAVTDATGDPLANITTKSRTLMPTAHRPPSYVLLHSPGL